MTVGHNIRLDAPDQMRCPRSGILMLCRQGHYGTSRNPYLAVETFTE